MLMSDIVSKNVQFKETFLLWSNADHESVLTLRHLEIILKFKICNSLQIILSAK